MLARGGGSLANNPGIRQGPLAYRRWVGRSTLRLAFALSVVLFFQPALGDKLLT